MEEQGNNIIQEGEQIAHNHAEELIIVPEDNIESDEALVVEEAHSLEVPQDNVTEEGIIVADIDDNVGEIEGIAHNSPMRTNTGTDIEPIQMNF